MHSIRLAAFSAFNSSLSSPRRPNAGFAVVISSVVFVAAPAMGVTVPISPTTLDLFRFANNIAGKDPSTTAEFTTFPRNLVPGRPAIFDDISNEYQMSTGLVTGFFPGTDGRQASHWRDDALTGTSVGIMDPTLAGGGHPVFPAVVPITAADVRSLDVIGYEAGDGLIGPSPMTITINPGPDLAANAAALAAFNRAALQWTSILYDDIDIQINAELTDGFASPNIIGSTLNNELVGPYDDLAFAMFDDANDDEPQDQIVGFLPLNLQTDFESSGSVDFEFSGNLLLTKANAQAIAGSLGTTEAFLDANFGLIDALIIFNSDFMFDFDNSDGVTDGFIDFETVAAHEIGHALGFISAVDDVNAIPEPASCVILAGVIGGFLRRRRA